MPVRGGWYPKSFEKKLRPIGGGFAPRRCSYCPDLSELAPSASIINEIREIAVTTTDPIAAYVLILVKIAAFVADAEALGGYLEQAALGSIVRDTVGCLCGPEVLLEKLGLSLRRRYGKFDEN